jgi:hypothetical protein
MLEIREHPPSMPKMLMVGPLGGSAGDPAAPIINAKNIDGGALERRCRRSGSAHHERKKHQWWDPWEAMSEIQEHPPSTQETLMVAPLGGDVGDPGVPTTNAKNIDSRPLGPHGGSGLQPGSKMCVVNLHEYDRQIVILLMDPTFPVFGPVMVDDP